MTPGRRAAVRRLATFVIVVAAFGFLYQTAAANWSDLREFEWHVRPGYLAGSILVHVGVLLFGVFLWSRVLANFGHDSAPFRDLLRIWSFSNATRYVPGGIWQFLAAAQMSRGAGVPGVLALTSMIVHVLLSLAAAVTISALTVPLSATGLSSGAAWLLRIALPVLSIAAVHPAVINRGLRLVPRILHREVLVWHGRWMDGVKLFLLACVSWLLYGVAYTIFVASLTPITALAWLPLTAVNALSFTAGYLAVLAPGGIGVRESAMTVLLAPHLPAGVAAVVSLAARLWSIVSEVLLALLALALIARRSGSTTLTPDE